MKFSVLRLTKQKCPFICSRMALNATVQTLSKFLILIFFYNHQSLIRNLESSGNSMLYELLPKEKVAVLHFGKRLFFDPFVIL